jgi:hypothetical protein
MAFRYLLYIDILGFSRLVRDDPDRISDLYEIVASLNVHNHPDFKAIVFSDTILVYNVSEEWGRANPSYYIMYLCEFAQDLQARLVGRDIYFRAVLVRGGFNHYELNGIPCFFGDALVYAYLSERKIKAIGLFMHSSIVRESDIFHTVKFNDEYAFVFITQGLERVQTNYRGEVPIPRELIEETDEIDSLSRDLLYIKQIYANAITQSSSSVKQKFLRTWRIFRKRYPEILGVLEENGFDWNHVSDGADWDTYIKRYPTSYSWGIKTRVDF